MLKRKVKRLNQFILSNLQPVRHPGKIDFCIAILKRFEIRVNFFQIFLRLLFILAGPKELRY